MLETWSFGCRRASTTDRLLCERVIGFDATGCVALSDVDDASTVTVVALRHQREDDD